MSSDVRVIAFYLPQFHPIPENDRWWGPGFTEWTNVTRGRPMYAGHYQPRRPGELGYYDLRVPDVRRRQEELARKYGIHAFCYYYYWFSGQRLLERPLDLMLADRESDFPFCICWANENWSRRWDGSEQDILMEQKHLPEDPVRFIEDLAPVLRDRRYLRVNGAPILLVYRPDIIPALTSVLRTWRKSAEDLGIGPLHLCAVQSFGYTSSLEDGFDAMVEFPPHSIGGRGSHRQDAGRRPGVQRQDLLVHRRHQILPQSGVRHRAARLPRTDERMGQHRPARLQQSHLPRRNAAELRGVAAAPAGLHPPTPFRRSPSGVRERVERVGRRRLSGAGRAVPGYGFLEATSRAVFGVPTPAALISTLRQINAGNDEALGALAELEHAIRVNEGIVNLIDTKKLLRTDSTRTGSYGRFHALEHSGVTLPATVQLKDVTGFLDALNSPNYAGGVTLNRSYDVLLMGWIAASRIEVDPNSPILFQLSNLESGARYIAQVRSRTRRDDVVAHLKSQRAYRHMSEGCSLHSGYRAYLNISAVEPGPYKLDAIVPAADGRGGAMLSLHSSITVL